MDSETNGLVENHSMKLNYQPEIIEFYGCIADLKTGEIEREVDALVRPAGQIPDKIVAVTGITELMLTEAPTFAQIADTIIDLIETAPLVIAHNASFDQELVDIELERIGKTVKWPRLLCTVEQTVHLMGVRLSLSNLHQHLFGELPAHVHRAKADTMTLLRCCVRLHEDGVL